MVTRNGYVLQIRPTPYPDTDWQLLYSTYLGGDCDDEVLGMAMNSSGTMYVIGRTESFTRNNPTATGFPVSAGAYDATFGDRDPSAFHCGTQTPGGYT